MIKPKIIKDAIKYLKEEGIYTDKDELAIKLLENTYTQYLQAFKEVSDRGQVLVVLDFNQNKKIVVNPSFNNQMQLQKELFKLIDSLYLTPKSRKIKEDIGNEDENPFLAMQKDIEKR